MKLTKVRNLKEEAKLEIANLFNFLEALSDENAFKFANFVISKTEEQLASNKEFYDNKNYQYREKFKKKYVNDINTTDDNIFDLIKIEVASPFSVFSSIMQYDIPDIMLSYDVIKLQFSSNDFLNFNIDENIKETYKKFINHLLNNLKFIGETKLNNSNAIVDLAYDNFRFNLMHESLNAFKSPIISIRKHIQNMIKFTSPDMSENYEKNLGVNENILEIIKENVDSSFCIFGDTGSGKTTLLRYLNNINFENKRNVCVIEDSCELFLNTPLSFVTNNYINIHDLFVASLRQNPSHLIIGETRTEEIIDIMETGLTACISTTIHAKSFQKAIERIYFMASPKHLPKQDVMDLISSSINMFIFIDNRKIKGVWVRNKKLDGIIYDMYDVIFEN